MSLQKNKTNKKVSISGIFLRSGFMRTKEEGTIRFQIIPAKIIENACLGERITVGSVK